MLHFLRFQLTNSDRMKARCGVVGNIPRVVGVSEHLTASLMAIS
jgi:hypothetical protein